MGVDVISYQKPEKKEESNDFLTQVSKPLAIANSVASLYSAVKPSPDDAMARRKKLMDENNTETNTVGYK